MIYFITLHAGLISCYNLLNDSEDPRVYLVMVCIVALVILVLCYGLQIFNRICSVIKVILIVWLLARYCEDKEIWFRVDVLTIYFLVWQCTYLTCKWEDHGLSCPLLILQQGSLCISISLTAYFYYDLIFQYLPIQFNFVFLWLWSLYDM
jgi:hypothetical protein